MQTAYLPWKEKPSCFCQDLNIQFLGSVCFPRFMLRLPNVLHQHSLRGPVRVKSNLPPPKKNRFLFISPLFLKYRASPGDQLQFISR